MLKGSLTIFVHTDLGADGLLWVNDADDEMIFDKDPNYDRPIVDGTGDVDVSAGTLTFEDCWLDYSFDSPWDLSGGTIHVTDSCRMGDATYSYSSFDIDLSGGELWVEQVAYPVAGFKTSGAFTMTAGTLDLDGAFRCSGGFDWSGGTIEVANGKSATFN